MAPLGDGARRAPRARRARLRERARGRRERSRGGRGRGAGGRGAARRRRGASRSGPRGAGRAAGPDRRAPERARVGLGQRRARRGRPAEAGGRDASELERERERASRRCATARARAAREAEALRGRARRRARRRQPRAPTRRARAAEALAREAEALQSERDGLAGRLASLEEMVATHSAFDEGVRALLARPEGLEVLGVVADALETDSAHERAVEAFLGDRLQAVLVPDAATRSAASATCSERARAAARFLPLASARTRVRLRPPARRSPREEPKVQGLLSDLYRVTGPHADAIRASLPERPRGRDPRGRPRRRSRASRPVAVRDPRRRDGARRMVEGGRGVKGLLAPRREIREVDGAPGASSRPALAAARARAGRGSAPSPTAAAGRGARPRGADPRRREGAGGDPPRPGRRPTRRRRASSARPRCSTPSAPGRAGARRGRGAPGRDRAGARRGRGRARAQGAERLAALGRGRGRGPRRDARPPRRAPPRPGARSPRCASARPPPRPTAGGWRRTTQDLLAADRRGRAARADEMAARREELAAELRRVRAPARRGARASATASRARAAVAEDRVRDIRNELEGREQALKERRREREMLRDALSELEVAAGPHRLRPRPPGARVPPGRGPDRGRGRGGARPTRTRRRTSEALEAADRRSCASGSRRWARSTCWPSSRRRSWRSATRS